ncbi:albusnodin family lasso peptide [Actinorugispora endophytica]
MDEIDELIVEMGDIADMTLGGNASTNENKREIYE